MVASPPNPEAEQRVRESAWVVLPAGGRDGPAPKLSLAGFDLPKPAQDRARSLWRTWWSSPMALMWSEWDAPQLARLLVLTARSWDGASAAGLSEVRQLEDRFGLSPHARRRLYWRIDGVDLPSTEARDLSGGAVVADDRALPAAGGSGDPRLRVVEGGKAG